jgi:L-lysine exporter family protein LysE/ArgO
MTAYFSGLLLGLVIILPIGAASLFVLNQGVQAGFPRAFIGILTVCFCDSFLILLGAVGASALLAMLGYQEVLIALGSIFLTVLGLLTLRTSPQQHSEVETLPHIAATVAKAVGVSLLNPHAVLDTIGIIGGAIAAQPADERVLFGVGSVSASWFWFLTLGIGAWGSRTLLTSHVKLWIQRGAGLLMLVFAGVLMLELM